MNILEVYKKYQIMPQLQEHQLRVAAVADMICQHFKVEIDRQNIVAACLLHDMGNIIKFDLGKTETLLNIKLDLDFWQKVRQDYIARYGEDEHDATMAIAKDLKVSQRVIELIESVSFLGAANTASQPDYGKKITEYCDDRVSPQGVVSLEQRIMDLRTRYAHKNKNPELRDAFEKAARTMEQQIFAQTDIRPEDITDSSVAGSLENLRNFNI